MICLRDNVLSHNARHIGWASKTEVFNARREKIYDRRGDDLLNVYTGAVVGHLSLIDGGLGVDTHLEASFTT